MEEVRKEDASVSSVSTSCTLDEDGVTSVCKFTLVKCEDLC